MRRLLSLSLLLTLVGATLFAQTPAPAAGQRGTGAATPAPPGGRGGRGPALVSPEVGADRTVTLRFRAPNAQQVIANGELDGKPHPMTKGDDGVWTVKVGPLAPMPMAATKLTCQMLGLNVKMTSATMIRRP